MLSRLMTLHYLRMTCIFLHDEGEEKAEKSEFWPDSAEFHENPTLTTGPIQ